MATFRFYFTPEELQELIDANGAEVLFTFQLTPNNDDNSQATASLTAQPVDGNKSVFNGGKVGCPHPCQR